MSDNRPFARAVRRRIRPIGALSAAAVLGAGLLVAAYVAQDDESETPRTDALPPSFASPAASAAPAPPSAVPSAAGVGAGDQVAVASGPVSVRYTFDGGHSLPVSDADGRFPMQIVTEAGGALNFAPVADADADAVADAAAPVVAELPRASGLAMQFPPRCDVEPKSCPRAILEGTRDDALNPGLRPLQYGASVLMTPADTGDGANVMQKGYSVGGNTQFKLQVDHDTAYPSCVIASQAKIFRVEPKVSMADSTWHTVTCTRSGSRLGITIDGVPRGSVFVPPGLSIANTEPLRIGGKGANASNDQFAGQIDNVFLTIS